MILYPLFFLISFLSLHICTLLYISIFDTCHLSVFDQFPQCQKVMPFVFDAFSFSKWHFSHTSVHYIPLLIYHLFPELTGALLMREGISYSFFVLLVVCFSSRMLGPKFITLHSQKKKSSFLVGNNLKMLFAEWLHPLSGGKNTTGTYAFTLPECHSIWLKWFVVCRLYLYCCSSFYIRAKYWTNLYLTVSWILCTISQPGLK